MNPVLFIPLLLASLAIAITSFTKNKDWLIVSFSAWLLLFVLTIVVGLR